MDSLLTTGLPTSIPLYESVPLSLSSQDLHGIRLAMVTDPKLQFSADLSKRIFVGETSGSLSQVNTRQMKEYMYVLKELRKMKRMNGKVKKSK